MSALLKQYKKQYENVWLADINGQEFVFRDLTRREYREAVEDAKGDDYLFEERICDIAVLHPEEYDFYKRAAAGLVKALANEIITISGFAHVDQQAQMLAYYRDDMQNFESQAETVIQLVFPQVREEEMQDWTQEKLMKRLARAEWIMKEIWQMPFEFAKKGSGEENEIEEEIPSIDHIALQIREQGGDPMLVLKEQLVKKKEDGYLEFPLIGGTRLLGNEEVLELVRKQIQRVPE